MNCVNKGHQRASCRPPGQLPCESDDPAGRVPTILRGASASDDGVFKIQSFMSAIAPLHS
jgi:hypothetical protein